MSASRSRRPFDRRRSGYDASLLMLSILQGRRIYGFLACGGHLFHFGPRVSHGIELAALVSDPGMSDLDRGPRFLRYGGGHLDERPGGDISGRVGAGFDIFKKYL